MPDLQGSVSYAVLDQLAQGLAVVNDANETLYINTMGWQLLKQPQQTSSVSLQQLETALGDHHPLISFLTHNQETYSDGKLILKRHLVEQNVRLITITPAQAGVSERLALEEIKEELAQAKKMAAVGNTISSVVHELNNPLTGISMNTRLANMTITKLEAELDNNKERINYINSVKETLNHIEREASKTATLLNELRQFARPAKLNLKLINMEDLVNSTIYALKSHPEFEHLTFNVTPYVSSNNECSRSTKTEEDVSVLCDRTKIEQIFYNLFKNTSDATNGKATIAIEFNEEIHPEEKDLRMLIISVKDDGPGIPQDIVDKIFEPFFTTKGHVGTGLGLSISFTTIEQHGGHLSVIEQDKPGTTFKITLPIFVDDDEF